MDFRRAEQKSCQNDDDKRLCDLTRKKIARYSTSGIQMDFRRVPKTCQMTTINGCPGYRAHLSNHEGHAPSGAGLSVKYLPHFFCPENKEKDK